VHALVGDVDALLAPRDARSLGLELEVARRRLELAANQPQQRALAGAVGADEAGPAGLEVEGGVGEEGTIVEGERERVRANRGGGGHGDS